MSGERRAFLARVSASLGRAGGGRPAPPATPPPVVDERVVRTCGREGESRETLARVFRERAARAGMHVHEATYATLREVVAGRVRELGIRRVVVGEVLAAFGIAGACSAAGASVEVGGADAARPFEHLYDVDAGITNVQAAIAETGTLVCTSGEGLARGLSLVPPVHMAVVFETDIVADMVDFLVRLSGPLPTNVVLISGPSKTADIEGVLITGVHGPRAVEVVVVR